MSDIKFTKDKMFVEGEMVKEYKKAGKSQVERCRLPKGLKLDVSKIKVGDKVCYHPGHKYENGIVKCIPTSKSTAIFVVYSCAKDWANFKNYTAVMTYIEDLDLGWK